MELDTNGNPSFRLPSPNNNIVLAKTVYTDGDETIKMLNDPRLFNNLAGPPYPYTRECWDTWFAMLDKGETDAFTQMTRIDASKKLDYQTEPWTADGIPVGAIRKVDPVTGAQRFIGTIGVHRSNSLTWPDEDGTVNFTDGLEEREAGNVWELGCE